MECFETLLSQKILTKGKIMYEIFLLIRYLFASFYNDFVVDDCNMDDRANYYDDPCLLNPTVDGLCHLQDLTCQLDSASLFLKNEQKDKYSYDQPQNASIVNSDPCNTDEDNPRICQLTDGYEQRTIDSTVSIKGKKQESKRRQDQKMIVNKKTRHNTYSNNNGTDQNSTNGVLNTPYDLDNTLNICNFKSQPNMDDFKFTDDDIPQFNPDCDFQETTKSSIFDNDGKTSILMPMNINMFLNNITTHFSDENTAEKSAICSDLTSLNNNRRALADGLAEMHTKNMQYVSTENINHNSTRREQSNVRGEFSEMGNNHSTNQSSVSLGLYHNSIKDSDFSDISVIKEDHDEEFSILKKEDLFCYSNITSDPLKNYLSFTNNDTASAASVPFEAINVDENKKTNHVYANNIPFVPTTSDFHDSLCNSTTYTVKQDLTNVILLNHTGTLEYDTSTNFKSVLRQNDQKSTEIINLVDDHFRKSLHYMKNLPTYKPQPSVHYVKEQAIITSFSNFIKEQESKMNNTINIFFNSDYLQS